MIGNLIDLFSREDEVAATPPQDRGPYDSLSKAQRRMLAFAGIADAGAALQGGQGNAASNLLSDFTARADQQRKAAAAAAQLEMQRKAQEMFMGIGGTAGAAEGATGVDALRAQKESLMNLLATNPEMEPAVTAKIADLDSQIEAIVQGQSELSNVNAGINAIDALLGSPDLEQIAGYKGNVNQWLNDFFLTKGLVGNYATLKTYIDQIAGVSFLQAYTSLKGGGSITEAESAKATAAQNRVQGALAGSTEDLVDALEEARALFVEARRKNPKYKAEAAQGDPTAMTKEEELYLFPNGRGE